MFWSRTCMCKPSYFSSPCFSLQNKNKTKTNVFLSFFVFFNLQQFAHARVHILRHACFSFHPLFIFLFLINKNVKKWNGFFCNCRLWLLRLGLQNSQSYVTCKIVGRRAGKKEFWQKLKSACVFVFFFCFLSLYSVLVFFCRAAPSSNNWKTSRARARQSVRSEVGCVASQPNEHSLACNSERNGARIFATSADSLFSFPFRYFSLVFCLVFNDTLTARVYLFIFVPSIYKKRKIAWEEKKLKKKRSWSSFVFYGGSI